VIFLLNMPVGLVALAMSYRYLPESRNPRAASIDVRGQLLAIVALGTLTVVLVEGRTLGATRTAALAAVVVLASSAFVVGQRRAAEPMIPAGFAGHRRLVVALAATFAMTFGTYGLLMVNSLAFQQQREATALETALVFLPMPLSYLALIPVAGVVARRRGSRLPMTVGLTLMGAGMLLYAAAGPNAPIGVLEVAFVLAGAGLAFNTGPAVAMALSAVPVERAGLAAGVVNLARLVGITVGIAVLGTVLATVGGDADSGTAFANGVRAAVLVGGIVEIAGAVVVSAFVTTARIGREVCHA
jgi:hypothetical protein